MDQSGQPGRWPEHDAAANRLAARYLSLLLVLYVGFIGAATLIVGTGELSLEKGLAKLSDLRANWSADLSLHSLRDVATNILLFIPLGALAAARLQADRLQLLSPWLALGTALSAAIESIQAFTDRTPDPIDLCTNTLGHVTGYLLVFAAIRRFRLRPAVLLGVSAGDHQEERLRAAHALAFIYICIYGILQLVPFDISVSLTRIYSKLLPGESGVPRIIVDPLFWVWQGPEGVLPLLYAVVALVPLAALKSHVNVVLGRDSVFAPIFFCTFYALAIEICQVFVLSRSSDIADVILAPAGGAIGVALARGWHRVQGDFSPPGSGVTVPLTSIALALYLGFVSILTWAPYQFESDASLVLQKLRHDTNWWPFGEHFAASSVGAARDLVEETLQYIPLGLLLNLELGRRWPRVSRLVRLICVTLACGALATLLEFSQVFCRGRFVDITDILLAGIGGAVGGTLVRVFASRLAAERGQL